MSPKVIVLAATSLLLASAACGDATRPTASPPTAPPTAVLATALLPAPTTAPTASTASPLPATPTLTTEPATRPATPVATPTALLATPTVAGVMPTPRPTMTEGPTDAARSPTPPTAPSPTAPGRLVVTPLTPAEAPPPPGTPLRPPFDSGLAALVEAARADLARRLGLDLAAVQVGEVRAVVWPDGALGCPQPGLSYPQVQVDGLFIRLRAAGRAFDYHSGGRRPPFLCERPTGTR